MVTANPRFQSLSESPALGVQARHPSWERFSWLRALLLTSLLVGLLAASPEPHSLVAGAAAEVAGAEPSAS